MILCVLHATSEELGASATTWHQESFRSIMILFPLFRACVIPCHIYPRDCQVTFRIHLPLVTLGVRHSSQLILRSFLVSVLTRFLHDPLAKCLQDVYQSVAIGSYSPEVRAFGTLITSTNV